MNMKVIACLATVAFGQTIDRNHEITDHSGYEVPFTRNRDMPINLKNLLHRISRTKPWYDSSVNNLIQKVSEGAAESYAMMLSGESPLSDTNTRNSRSNADKSAIRSVGGSLNYVDLEMQRLGFQTEYHHYSDTYPPNLIATLPGTSKPDEIVVLGAHLDDRDAANNAENRAPGANDDGSGSAALLASALAIAESGSTFERTLVFEWYTGEEQGLVGSRALAKMRASRGDKVVAQVQQDMTAVQLPGDALGVAFVQDSRAVSLELTKDVEALAAVYADPALTLHHEVLSGSSCCSDHQGYAENGFASVGLIEPRGYTGDPMYHKVGDVVHRSDYSIRQLTLAGRVALAAAATIAGLENVPTRAGIVSTVAVEERQDSGSNHHLASAVVGVGGALGLVALGLAYAKKTRALHADKDEDTATPYATTNTDQNTNTNLDPETNTAYVRSCTADNVEVQRNYPPMSMSQKQSQPVFNLN